MKRLVWMLALGFVVVISFGMHAQAQPKEVAEAVTTTYYVVSKVLPVGEGRVFMNYEATGLVLANAGEGLFHEATIRVLGNLTAEKGKFNDERGWGVWSLQNGDKVFMTYTWTGEVKQGGSGEAMGTVTIMGGTGKCVGIRGSFPATRRMVKTSIEGVGQSYLKATIKYTLY